MVNFVHPEPAQSPQSAQQSLPLTVKILAGAAIMMVVAVISVAAYRFWPAGTNEQAQSDIANNPVYFLPEEVQEAYQKDPSCPLETTLCPDGETVVGRTGPNCSFPACPGELAPPSPNETLQNFANPAPIADPGKVPPPMTDEELLQYLRDRQDE